MTLDHSPYLDLPRRSLAQAITDRALAPRYLVTDCAFNRANYLSLIGTMHDANSIPSYAAIKLGINPIA